MPSKIADVVKGSGGGNNGDYFKGQEDQPNDEGPDLRDEPTTEPSHEKGLVTAIINKYINYGRDSDKSFVTLSTLYANLQKAIREKNLMTEFNKSGFDYHVF